MASGNNTNIFSEVEISSIGDSRGRNEKCCTLGEAYLDVVEIALMLVGGFPHGTVTAHIACGNSIAIAFIDKGQVYS